MSNFWQMLGNDAAHNYRTDAFGPDHPVEHWSTTLGSAITTCPVLGNGGVTYVGARDGKLYAVGADGKVAWTFDSGYPYYYTNLAIGNDTIFSTGPTTYALDTTGAMIWQFEVPGIVNGAPTIGADGTLYFVSKPTMAGRNSILFALDPINGRVRWTFEMALSSDATPTVDAQGRVYVGSDGIFYSLDADGGERWSYTDPTSEFLGSAALNAEEDTLYVPVWSKNLDQNRLLALDAATGSEKWHFAPNQAMARGASPAVAENGAIYMGFLNLFSIWPDGQLRWQGEPACYPALMALDGRGMIYTTCQNQEIHGYNSAGKLLWTLESGNTGSGLIIGLNNLLILGGANGNLATYGN